jgi:ligand-binding sensor domain-containing protein/signal transduction histidine kinase
MTKATGPEEDITIMKGCYRLTATDQIVKKISHIQISKLQWLNIHLNAKKFTFHLNILFFLIVTILFIPSILSAQVYEFEFDRISIEKGLSQSSVFTIIQDKKGFLWFGTQDGLNKFDGYNFTVFKHNSADSLSISDNWITSLCEDHLGNIWVGTSGGGLNKFDPITERFIHYKHQNNDPMNQEYSRVQSVLEDSDRNLWIGTDGGGLSKLDRSTGKFINFIHDENINTSINDNRIQSLLEDQNGNLWIGTNDGGLSLLKKDLKNQAIFQRFTHLPNDRFSLSSNRILSLFEDSNGKIWIGTDTGLNLYDPVNNQFYRFKNNPKNEYSLSNNVIYTIFEDMNHTLWIGTDYGLNFYDQANDHFWHINHNPSNPNSLSNDLVRSIYKDASGTIWVGTYGGGLNHYDWRKKKFRHFKNVVGDRNSINDNNVWSILISRSGHLWIGTNKGINKINRIKNKVQVFRHSPFDPYSLSDDIVRVIFEDSYGDIWFGTNKGGLNKYNPLQKKFQRYVHIPDDSLSISNNTIRAIFEDKQGLLWIGTWGGLNLFDAKTDSFTHFIHDPENPTSISDDRVRCLFEDRDSTLWVGTYKGLNKFDRKKGEFIHYMYNPDDSTSLSHDRVLALHQDRAGNIWIATYGGGLNKFDPKKESFVVYTEKDGLSNNAVYGILEDEKGNLWMSTNKGISKFNPVTESFKNFNVNDGLQSDEFNGGAYAKSNQGELFFGGINGFNAFFPEKITENKFIPPVVLTSFKLFDEEVDLDSSISNIKNISLLYSDNFFAFEFAALDYSNPEKNQYAYKLEGFDRDWIRSGNRRYANYTNLDGGEYVLKVKGSNSDGIWNEAVTSIKISIDPPIWAEWWFRISAVLLILSIGYSAYSYRMRKVEKQQKYLEDQIAERTWEINERNRQLNISKKETDNILHNIEEGIFLINKKFEIESQYSTALETIFEEEKLIRKKFLELMENKVTHKIHTSITEFVELMFDDEVEEKTIVDLNPMSEIKLTFESEDGKWTKNKHLSFKFRRIRSDEGNTEELIVAVNDLSHQIRLAQELEESQEYSRKQMEWMLSILHVEPQLIKEFMEGVNLELNYIDTVLRESNQEKDLHKILDKIFRSMHMIKGNAALIDMKFFVEKAHEFEENIAHIKEKQNISGSDFVPLVLMLNEMRSILRELDNLVERLSKIHMNFRPKRSYENKVFITSLQNLVKSLSRDLNKKIELVDNDFEAGIIPYRYRLTTRQILIQLIRNSVYHGIESVEERKKAGKNPSGRIEISSFKDNGSFGFRLIDDGRGIQVNKLREKAKESGKWSEAELKSWTDQKVAETIFCTGISTLESANLVAGRGVGMDLVKEKIDNAGGEIILNYQEGQSCEFVITMPVKQEINQEIETEESVKV